MKNSFSFYVIPDLHMIPPGLTLSARQRLDQRCLLETPAIHKAVFGEVLSDKETDVILVPGDLTNSGEKEAHEELVKELSDIEKQGKKIFVISAAHDYCEKTRFEGSTPTKREELPVLYRQFMHDKACSIAPDGHSYAAMLTDGVFLLALNDDKKPQDGVTGYGFTEETFSWIKAECEKAKDRSDRIFAMTHHPLLPPSSLYPVIAKGDMVWKWQETAAFLADCGVEIIFTGHTHMHSINFFDSPNGNRIYDINTASITGYPTAFRKVTLNGNTADIKTLPTPDYEWAERGTLCANEYAYNNFRRLLNDKADMISSGTEGFAKVVGMKAEKAKKLAPVIGLAGTAVEKLTMGGLGRLLAVGSRIDPSIKKTLFKDVIFDLVLNMYHGDERFTPDTPIYQAMNAIFERVEKLCRLFGIKGVSEITGNLRAGFLYNLPPADWDTKIELRL